MIWIGLKMKKWKKIRPIKNTWFDWLINYIPKPIRISQSVLKDKFISLFLAYSTSDNIKFTAYNDVNEVVNEFFESGLLRYQGNLETSITKSDFIFGLV